jgi:hypothetical protein
LSLIVMAELTQCPRDFPEPVRHGSSIALQRGYSAVVCKLSVFLKSIYILQQALAKTCSLLCGIVHRKYRVSWTIFISWELLRSAEFILSRKSISVEREVRSTSFCAKQQGQ